MITGFSPVQLPMGRQLRSRFDRLFPNMQWHVQNLQLKQAKQHDSSKPLRSFSGSDSIEDFFLPAVLMVNILRMRQLYLSTCSNTSQEISSYTIAHLPIAMVTNTQNTLLYF